MNDPWALGALIALGAFHGLNPAMGWLFAVALGLQEHNRKAVLQALLPIALGHAISIAVVVAVVAVLRRLIDLTVLKAVAATVLIGFGVYRLVAKHKARVGMRVGPLDLTLWSFLMATAHGAGIMLIPVLLRLPLADAGESGSHAHHLMDVPIVDSVSGALAAVGIHTLAMLVVTGAIAMIVYEWVGVAFLRRGWVNLDLVWAFALIAAGVILLIPGLI